jgi:hypothetical protein
MINCKGVEGVDSVSICDLITFFYVLVGLGMDVPMVVVVNLISRKRKSSNAQSPPIVVPRYEPHIATIVLGGRSSLNFTNTTFWCLA